MEHSWVCGRCTTCPCCTLHLVQESHGTYDFLATFSCQSLPLFAWFSCVPDEMRCALCAFGEKKIGHLGSLPHPWAFAASTALPLHTAAWVSPPPPTNLFARRHIWTSTRLHFLALPTLQDLRTPHRKSRWGFDSNGQLTFSSVPISKHWSREAGAGTLWSHLGHPLTFRWP